MSRGVFCQSPDVYFLVNSQPLPSVCPIRLLLIDFSSRNAPDCEDLACHAFSFVKRPDYSVTASGLDTGYPRRNYPRAIHQSYRLARHTI